MLTFDAEVLLSFWLGHYSPEVIAAEQRFVEHLSGDLESGEWDRRWGELRTMPEYPSSLRLVIGHP